MFKIAAQKKFRFATARGLISTESLFDMPLLSDDGFNLDAVARGINNELQEVSTNSFVDTKENPKKIPLEQKLELVKEIIADKIAANKAAVERSARNEERRRLLDALARKKDDALSEASIDELEKKLEALDA